MKISNVFIFSIFALSIFTGIKGMVEEPVQIGEEEARTFIAGRQESNLQNLESVIKFLKSDRLNLAAFKLVISHVVQLANQIDQQDPEGLHRLIMRHYSQLDQKAQKALERFTVRPLGTCEAGSVGILLTVICFSGISCLIQILNHPEIMKQISGISDVFSFAFTGKPL